MSAGASAPMPMFPIGAAHLPGDDVVLRVFEPRYVSMVKTLLAGEQPGPEEMTFGSVLILRGSEVGGGDVRATSGVAVRIVDVAAPPEGGYLVAGRAGAVIVVDEWLADDPHPWARVTATPPDRLDASGRRVALERLVRSAQMVRLMLVDAARAAHRELIPAAEHRAQLGNLAAGRVDEADPNEAFWLVARSLPCGPGDRLAMLSGRTLPERLDTLERVAEHVREVLAFRLSGP